MAYSGAYGRREDRHPPAPAGETPARPDRGPRKQPEGLSGAVGALMKKLESVNMETDDLIMALILYLMYRESGDKDLLIMLGAMLLT